MIGLILEFQFEGQRSFIHENELRPTGRTIADNAVSEQTALTAAQDAGSESRSVAIFPTSFVGVRWVGISHERALSDIVQQSLRPMACSGLMWDQLEWAVARQRRRFLQQHQLDAAVARQEGIVGEHRVLVGNADHLRKATRAKAEAAENFRGG